ncbi:hypothetical protein [Rhodospira trueperi]|uniref:Uncharacterized protein n=1 Tax=Rhodospira trueperi TaxID=69960 RepID=A0A1G7HWH6_9PROT|nr:hypothetical protein [Rhodospira trueperi]SDF04792.1 hypothetical protein SAMN05421720_12614 [Rhodospira trueperi]
MPGWLSGLAARLGRYALAAGAVLGALWWVRRDAAHDARQQDRAEALEETTHVQDRMLSAGADRPRGRAGLARRLRDGRF